LLNTTTSNHFCLDQVEIPYQTFKKLLSNILWSNFVSNNFCTSSQIWHKRWTRRKPEMQKVPKQGQDGWKTNFWRWEKLKAKKNDAAQWWRKKREENYSNSNNFGKTFFCKKNQNKFVQSFKSWLLISCFNIALCIK